MAATLFFESRRFNCGADMSQFSGSPGNPQDVNPYQFSPEQKGPDESAPKVGGLGSLAQASRGQQLKSARSTLIAIGVLTVVVNVIFMAILPGQVRQELQKNGQAANDQQLAIATGVAMSIQGVFLVLGIVFIVCGLLVKRFPVPATLTALVLYILSTVGMMGLDPASLARGIIIKIIIIVALVKAVQAAFAYQKEMQTAGV